MKKLILFLLMVGLTSQSFAQFKLSGNMANITKADTFYINIPYIYGYYHDNDIAIPMDAKGNFNIVLNISEQKFGNIRFANKEITLLLKPGKSLVMNYVPADSSITFNGTAAPENHLLNKLDLNSIPFFAKDNSFAKLTMPQLQQKVIAVREATRNDEIALVQASALSTRDKKLIIQEVKANYILQLNYFARGIMDRQVRARIDSFVLAIYNNVPLAPDVLPAGPMYYNFSDSYIGYQENADLQRTLSGKISGPLHISTEVWPHYR
jgi:hypothetical protein